MVKTIESNGSWIYTIQNKEVLTRPIILSFQNKTEGAEYSAKLERILATGTIPAGFESHTRIENVLNGTIGGLIRDYLEHSSINHERRKLLITLVDRIGYYSVLDVSVSRYEQWLMQLKREYHLKPATIRNHVSTLSRCFDWGVSNTLIKQNPLRSLPSNYSSYSEQDMHYAGGEVIDESRSRRLGEDEEKAINDLLSGSTQTKLKLKHKPALHLLFILAVETSMRMREMYTLEPAQIDTVKSVITLTKTKNGDSREVPLSSNAVRALNNYNYDGPYVFPWWNGYSASLAKTSCRLSRQYARIFIECNATGLRFHDLRHEAISRLFERTTLSDTLIAKITGHRDPRVLLRYVNVPAERLVDRLW